ncbi:hypothetical protein [Synechocystis salina]|uniref:Uncharacterized protein n=1 Tax=Synechocystis salina LEGE 00031 TaxID=1828736 RepID=A0ABR9VMM4_9SYNC|nr:hypothetical protein [Synechocystis salina]MBE9240892.1 hypothetical protein [Synechocystis salina LEGE 00041]MBE9252598.1 hypothetical protein [Synechocystis salina LEGE 00031]
MKQIIPALITFSFFSVAIAERAPSIAALPPQYQNIKDLEVMVNYVKENPDVAATLKSIDLANQTINYGQDCQIRFERKPSNNPPGWVGPAEPLQFKAVNCLEE